MAGRLKSNRARSQRGFYFQKNRLEKGFKNQKILSERAPDS